ncbi:hypothetical protein J4477_04905 [Candidatus Pacearchaeota archaeon]|nr:hypothetical protein [Candidatus Pacearchaeota archaeon]
MAITLFPVKWHENRAEYGMVPVVYASEAQSNQKASIDRSGIIDEEDIINLDEMVQWTLPSYYPGMDNKTGERLDLMG